MQQLLEKLLTSKEEFIIVLVESLDTILPFLNGVLHKDMIKYFFGTVIIEYLENKQITIIDIKSRMYGIKFKNKRSNLLVYEDNVPTEYIEIFKRALHPYKGNIYTISEWK